MNADEIRIDVLANHILTRMFRSEMFGKGQRPEDKEVQLIAEYEQRLIEKNREIQAELITHMEEGAAHTILDKHKYAATVALTVLTILPLEIRPLKVSWNTKYSLLANEVLSVHMGMEVIRRYLLSEFADETGADPACLERFMPECKWPSNINDEKEVLLNQYYTMFYLRKGNDILSSAPLLSYIFFSLDGHNRDALDAAFPKMGRRVMTQ